MSVRRIFLHHVPSPCSFLPDHLHLSAYRVLDWISSILQVVKRVFLPASIGQRNWNEYSMSILRSTDDSRLLFKLSSNEPSLYVRESIKTTWQSLRCCWLLWSNESYHWANRNGESSPHLLLIRSYLMSFSSNGFWHPSGWPSLLTSIQRSTGSIKRRNIIFNRRHTRCRVCSQLRRLGMATACTTQLYY